MYVSRALKGIALVAAVSGCTGVIGGEGGPVAADPLSGSVAEDNGISEVATFNPDPSNNAPRIEQFSCVPLSGDAPLTVRCTVRVTDADVDSGLGCVASGGDGEEAPLVSCEGTVERVFSNAGAHALTIRATDGKSAVVTQSANVQVTEPANRPPVIASFVAANVRGSIPFDASFTFQVSDPEGSAVTCELDVDGNGTPEQTLENCQNLSTATVRIERAGAFVVKLTAKDAGGASASANANLEGRAPVGDVVVGRMEFGQTVMDAEPTLVEGKSVFVRAAVYASVTGLRNVAVKLVGVGADGAVVGELAMTGPAALSTTEPTALAENFTASAPAEWIKAGVKLRVVADANDDIAETNETNNNRELTMRTAPGYVLPLTIVPVVQGGARGTTPNFKPLFLATWPLKDVSVTERAPYTFNGTLASGGGGWSELLNQLASVRRADGSQNYYYGVARVTYRSGVAGIGFIGQPTGLGRDDSIDTLIHEVGHNFGLPHAPCGGPASPDPSYPYAQGRIGSVGYDVTTGRTVNTTAYDLMSYCNPVWVSDYNYKKVQGFLARRPPPAVNGAAATDMQTRLLVRGTLNGNDVKVEPLVRLTTQAAMQNDEGGNTTVRIRLSGDNGTQEVSAELLEPSELGGQQFIAVVPDVGTLRSISVAKDGRSVFSRASLQPPTLAFAPETSVPRTGTVRVRWDANAYPYAAVAHVMGNQRTTLSLGLTGGLSELSTEGLPAGGQIEVGCSDGLSTVTWRMDR